MNPFDGRFALNYIYPLAAAAYDEPWNAASNPVLSGFKQVAEIRLDTQSRSFQTSLMAAPSAGSHGLLAAMRRPKGAASSPSAPAQNAAVATTDAAGLPVDDRFGWVCIDPSHDRLIITFRGTQTAADWGHDLDFYSEPYRPIPGAGTVHQGFQHVYYAVRDNLLALLKERCSSIREVLVTGHSLGAALTTLALPDIVSFLRSQPGVPANLGLTLYNLASPRVGHTDFKNFFDTQFPCWRVVNDWDVVPRVPPTLAGYTHVGAELPIHSGFHFNVAENHELATGYLPGLKLWSEQNPSGAMTAAMVEGDRAFFVPPGISA